MKRSNINPNSRGNCQQHPRDMLGFVQAASAFFQRQKVLALAMNFGTFYILMQ